MTLLTQREPREVDEAYLAYVRTLPCTICRRPGPNDAAHLRAAAPQYGKRYTGKGEKPSDRWALPLCRSHHEDQHRGNELNWWARQGFPDPFALAIALYAGRPVAARPRPERPRNGPKVRVRRPKVQRAKITSRTEIQSRGFEPGHRPLLTRNNLRKERSTP